MHQFHFAMNRASTLPKLKGLVLRQPPARKLEKFTESAQP
jgi:hypothetical protein